MTSTIKVNNIQNQCGANIINESSNTITIGASGDTVTLASGASQTGFGRTGTVDWQTGSIKTANFTAASGEGYFCNTSGGAFTATLPASPSAGDIVSFSDYTNTFQTNSLTIGRNSEPIGGIAKDAILSTEGQSVTFVYVDGTEGWKNIQDSTSNVVGNQFIIATGGTITTCGNCKIHTFTGPGTFCVSQVHPCSANNQVSYMVVAGGGSGGGTAGGGGGGAGGFREDKSPVTPYTASPLEGAGGITVTATAFPITVGAGGAGSVTSEQGNDGANSIFSTITSAGGGGGGHGGGGSTANAGRSGGSGGGGGMVSPAVGLGGSGNTPPVSPPQGQSGGQSSVASPNYRGGGGGGAGAVGEDSPGPGDGPRAGNGGNGVATEISGTPVTRAGGGGGAVTTPGKTAGTGGSGGGGAGGVLCASGGNGTANTGGGGGGLGCTPGSTGSGGSGVVIIRYKYK